MDGIARLKAEALIKRTIYDKDYGRLLWSSFTDYAFPSADIVLHVKFDLHTSPCTTNPLGVKGAGEAGAIGAPPSVINTICGYTGVKHVDMPATAAVP